MEQSVEMAEIRNSSSEEFEVHLCLGRGSVSFKFT